MKDDRGILDLTKQIETLKAELNLLSSQLGDAVVRIKDLEVINDSHRKLNGELRKELEHVRKTLPRIS
jgi:predicted  nucleic acid-binding Zn-ribbon protein